MPGTSIVVCDGSIRKCFTDGQQVNGSRTSGFLLILRLTRFEANPNPLFGRRSTREIIRRRAHTQPQSHARSVPRAFGVSLALGSASCVSSAASPGARRTPGNSSENRIFRDDSQPHSSGALVTSRPHLRLPARAPWTPRAFLGMRTCSGTSARGARTPARRPTPTPASVRCRNWIRTAADSARPTRWRSTSARAPKIPTRRLAGTRCATSGTIPTDTKPTWRRSAL